MASGLSCYCSPLSADDPEDLLPFFLEGLPCCSHPPAPSSKGVSCADTTGAAVCTTGVTLPVTSSSSSSSTMTLALGALAFLGLD